MVKAVVQAIRDGAVRKERGKAFEAGFSQGVFASDVQIGFLLSGERGGRQVFGCGGATHCHISVRPVFGAELRIGAFDFCPDSIRDARA